MTHPLQYKSMPENQVEAIRRFKAGETPCFSTGICESVTAGYGDCDFYGYWEFPLPVNQETLEIEV